MGIYKSKFNPFTKKLQWVLDGTLITFKESVANYSSLPITGNAKNDARITNDDGHLYVWSLEETSGALTDWVDQGDILDLTWDAISGKPSSTPAEIDAIVSNGVVSEEEGDYKKVTLIQYNPTTGLLNIEYEP